MNYKVIYFTRTGTTKKIAKKISNKISSEVIQITDNKNWKGVFGFIKGGFYASTNKDVKIEVHGNVKDADEIILISPLWAGKICPAVNKFIKNRTLANIHLIISSNGSNLKDKPPINSIHEIVRSKNNEDKVIEALINILN